MRNLCSTKSICVPLTPSSEVFLPVFLIFFGWIFANFLLATSIFLLIFCHFPCHIFAFLLKIFMVIHAMIMRDIKGDFTRKDLNWLQMWQFEPPQTRGSCLFLGSIKSACLKVMMLSTAMHKLPRTDKC